MIRKVMTLSPCHAAKAVVNKYAISRSFLIPILTTGMLLATSAAHAYDLQTSPTLLGNMGGLRTSLGEHGVALSLSYVSEAALRE